LIFLHWFIYCSTTQPTTKINLMLYEKACNSRELLSIKPNYAVIYNEYFKPYDHVTYDTSPQPKNQLKLSYDLPQEFHNYERDIVAECSKANSIDNLQDNRQNGTISDKSSRRLRTALDWLCVLARDKRVLNKRNKRYYSYKLAMLTLTLPCQQLHTDKEVKNKLLNQFLTSLRKQYGLKNYIWRAEKQFNGNIHFHIIIDIYINHAEINHIWNRLLDHYGYIAHYRANMQQHHKAGFVPYAELLKDWPLEKQKEAYVKGFKNNWCNPTSTTDIHSLRKIKNTKAYLAKYLTKEETGSKMLNKAVIDYKQKNGVQYVAPEVIKSIKSDLAERLKIDGNLWYISQTLSKLKGAVCVITDEIREELDKIRSAFNDKVIYLEHCTLIKFSINSFWKNGFKAIVGKFGSYINTIRSELPELGTRLIHGLGLQLDLFETPQTVLIPQTSVLY